jgi:hypothetical protein
MTEDHGSSPLANNEVNIKTVRIRTFFISQSVSRAKIEKRQPVNYILSKFIYLCLTAVRHLTGTACRIIPP